jgi:hypothetical protein
VASEPVTLGPLDMKALISGWMAEHNAKLSALTAERDRLLLQMDNLRSRISNDAYAMSFQTMGQYRTALLNAFPRPCSICRREDCTTEHACE